MKIIYIISIILGLTTLTAYAGVVGICPYTIQLSCDATTKTYQLKASLSNWTPLLNRTACTMDKTANFAKAELQSLNTSGATFSDGPFMGKLRPYPIMYCYYKVGTSNVGNIRSVSVSSPYSFLVRTFGYNPSYWTFTNSIYTCIPPSPDGSCNATY